MEASPTKSKADTDQELSFEGEGLLSKCVQILKVIQNHNYQNRPDKRSARDIKLLIKMAQKIDFFARLSEEQSQQNDINIIERCVQVLNHRRVHQEQRVFSAGDIGSQFYIILRGEVGIQILLPKPNENNVFELKEVNVLKAGQSFGELALINEQAMRTATIVAKQTCDFATMEKADYKQILGKIQQMKIVKKIYFLNQYPFFSNWSFREMETVSYHFQEIKFNYAQSVYKTGDPSDSFYLIKEGEFQLFIELEYTELDKHQNPLKRKIKQKKIHKVATLGSGNYFGEETLFQTNMVDIIWSANANPNIQQDGSLKIEDEHKIIQEKVAKRITDVICLSHNGSLYQISREDIGNRFWDEKTVGIFVPMIKLTFEHRRNQVKRIRNAYASSLRVENELQNLNQLLSGADSTPQEDAPKFGLKTEGSQQHLNMIEMMNKKHPVISSSQLKPQKIIKLPYKLVNTISSNHKYKMQSRGWLEESSEVAQILDKQFQTQLRIDRESMQKFTQLFSERNFSFSQVRNYYQQKSFHEQNMISKQAYRRQFFKFKEKRRRSVPSVQTHTKVKDYLESQRYSATPEKKAIKKNYATLINHSQIPEESHQESQQENECQTVTVKIRPHTDQTPKKQSLTDSPYRYHYHHQIAKNKRFNFSESVQSDKNSFKLKIQQIQKHYRSPSINQKNTLMSLDANDFDNDQSRSNSRSKSASCSGIMVRSYRSGRSGRASTSHEISGDILKSKESTVAHTDFKTFLNENPVFKDT